MKKELLKENSVRGRFPITKFGNDGLFLQRQTATTGDKEDPRQKPPEMTALYKRGFTLIELLVVVLIVAILAAVALPQYNKAVLKARFAEIETNLHALAQAQARYYLEHDEYANDISQLDIELPQCIPLPGISSCEYRVSEQISYSVPTECCGTRGLFIIYLRDLRLCGGEHPVLGELYASTNNMFDFKVSKLGFTKRLGNCDHATRP